MAMAGSGSEHVFPVDVRSFQTDVIGQSRDRPVVLLFYAQQVPASVDTLRQLEQLAAAYGGKFALGRVDVGQDPTLAQHLRVQNIPSIRVIRDGQMVDQLDGPQGERPLRRLLDKHTMSSGELLKQALGELLERRAWGEALALVERALRDEPGNPAFLLEAADLQARQGNLDLARRTLERVPEETPERARPATRIAVHAEAATLPDVATLQARVAASERDLDAHHALALRHAAEGRDEAALESALAILALDRKYGDELGRRTLVRLFELQPKGSPLVKDYRRRMFNLLH
jgi:putative thioredoxin